jgi:hypothetical protein
MILEINKLLDPQKPKGSRWLRIIIRGWFNTVGGAEDGKQRAYMTIVFFKWSKTFYFTR